MMVPKRRYLSYLRERWWLALSFLVFTLSVTLVYETVRTPLFTSFAQIYPCRMACRLDSSKHKFPDLRFAPISAPRLNC